jgi:uncharacterized caspase-like protein
MGYNTSGRFKLSGFRDLAVSSRFRFVAALAALVSMTVIGDALAGNIALVIGNSRYKNVTPLPNPTNDAALVADVFKKAGFDVDSRRDMTASDLKRALRDFGDRAKDADIAVVYYAGHGIEVDGNNYLVPVDAMLERDVDVEDEGISLDRILRTLDPAKRLRLVILDACRDNPFSKTMKRTLGTRSVGRGLAKVEPTNSDTLIAFAAKAGSTASDGDGGNSPFTTALAKYLPTPGLDLRLAFGKVRDEVVRSTNNRQEPFVYGSLGGDTVSLVPGTPGGDPTADARREYEFAAQIGTKQAWESFLAVRSTGLYADLARAQYNKLRDAEQASAKADVATQKAEDLARAKFEELKKQAAEEEKKKAPDAVRKQAEQTQRDLEAARKQVEEAKKQAEEARRQIEEAKKQAIEEARREVEAAKKEAAGDQAKVAALSPPGQPVSREAVVGAAAMDASDIGRLLQAHLKRVGCDPGATDGGWGDSSRQALEKFNKYADTKFDVKLASLQALDGVRGKTGRICPLTCAKGQKVDGDACVQITCDGGFALGGDGVCHKKPDPAPKAAARQEPRASAPASGGGKCFTFNGKRFCE